MAEYVYGDEHERAIDRAQGLLRDRGAVYGDIVDNHSNIAAGWSVIAGVPITAGQALLMMDWVKTCRLVQTPTHQDSVDDKIPYTQGYDDAIRRGAV